jgi:hypothetical protein
LIEGFVFVPVLELADLDLFHVFNVNNLIVEPIDFSDKLFDLGLVLVVLDVEVVKDFLFFGFSEVGMSVFVVEFLFKGPRFLVFLLEEPDKILVFIDKMGILCEQQLNLVLKIVDSLVFSHLKHELFVDSKEFIFEGFGPGSPVLGFGGFWDSIRRVVGGIAGRAAIANVAFVG